MGIQKGMKLSTCKQNKSSVRMRERERESGDKQMLKQVCICDHSGCSLVAVNKEGATNSQYQNMHFHKWLCVFSAHTYSDNKDSATISATKVADLVHHDFMAYATPLVVKVWSICVDRWIMCVHVHVVCACMHVCNSVWCMKLYVEYSTVHRKPYYMAVCHLCFLDN